MGGEEFCCRIYPSRTADKLGKEVNSKVIHKCIVVKGNIFLRARIFKQKGR
jgi:hypothetical protein